MVRKAVFPGSFDPITIGHTDLIYRALNHFDEIIIAIGLNSAKKYMAPAEVRMNWLKTVFDGDKRISVMSFEGLTAEFCRTQGASAIIRGLRSAQDYEFEKTIAQLNAQLWGGLETYFLAARPEHSHISSTIVREILQHGGNAAPYLPEVVAQDIKAWSTNQ